MSGRLIRDPETGQFMSVDEDDRGVHDVDEPERVEGVQRLRIPPADLSTGDTDEDNEGQTAEVIDFGDVLGSDEVFLPHIANLEVQIDAGQDATAEHLYRNRYWLRSQPTLGDALVLNTSFPLASGVLDVATDQSDDDDIIFSGYVVGAGDLRDTATGTAAGGSYTHVQHHRNFLQEQLPLPAYDQDDELYIPSRTRVRGSDDQSFNIHFVASLVGRIVEV